MFLPNISLKSLFRLRLGFCLALLILLSACTNNQPVSNLAVITPVSDDTFFIPVSAKPDIFIKSENAAELVFTGSDTQQNISTNKFRLPYTKHGNTVTIDFGIVVVQSMEIKIPREANLTVIMTNGNVAVNAIQGQLAMTLVNGTITINNFMPQNTNTLKTHNGTIKVNFAANASCNIQAQTDFGAITSSYPAIQKKRNAMKANASGTIGAGSGATVTVRAGYGSISIGHS